MLQICIHTFIRRKHIRMAEEQDGRGTSTKTRDTNGPRRSSTKAGGRAKVRRRPGGSTKGEGVRQSRYKRPRQSPTKNARVRRRLNERRRFNEGHKGREGGFDEGQGFRRRLGGFDGLCRRLCAIRPPYAVLIGLPLNLNFIHYIGMYT